MTLYANHAPNAATHRLYVVWAMQHLTIIKNTLKKLDQQSNFIAGSTYSLLDKHREDIVLQNTAYQEAAWRLLIGQTVRDGQIYDPGADRFIPHQDQNKDDTSDIGVDGYTPEGVYSAKDTSISITVLKDNAEPPGKEYLDSFKHFDSFEISARKTHANKLTTEQRRINGRKGALIRDNKRRSREAVQAKTCIVYAVVDGQIKNELGRRKNSSKACHFGSGEVAAGTCESYVVFDTQGFIWICNPLSQIAGRQLVK